jgi:3-oxoacyl-[acyl-carrier protein] reductase
MMKTVFITGTNRGIGKAILKQFIQNGWNAIAHARKPTPEFEDFISELAKSYSITITPIYFDMQDENEMKNAVKEIIYTPKITIDALVNNAGIIKNKLFMMFPMSEIRDIFEVNLFAQMRLTQLVIKRMPKQSGSIVNVSSIAGINFSEAQSAYGVSKAALLAWTKVLSIELMGKIRVNAVAPGQTDTDMGHQSDIAMEYFIKSLGRLVNPQDVANAVYWLSSDDAAFISGVTLKIDGGIRF